VCVIMLVVIYLVCIHKHIYFYFSRDDGLVKPNLHRTREDSTQFLNFEFLKILSF